tara:strand:- start:15 stop:203 length:189 start_codon:yes stop_codon:yes gene_type:complete
MEMKPIVVVAYTGDLDNFVKDLFKYEKILDKWKKNHPNHEGELKAEIDGGEYYTITISCKKQ